MNEIQIAPGELGISAKLTDKQLVLWTNREARFSALIKNTHERELLMAYVLYLSNGGRTKKFMADNNLQWSDLREIIWIHKDLNEIVSAGREIGEIFRMEARKDEAHRRAVEGTDKPVFHRGEICGYVKEYSDQLLAMLLKADDPDRFTDRKKVTHEGVMLNFHVEGIDGFKR